jgi:hypothetical protein
MGRRRARFLAVGLAIALYTGFSVGDCGAGEDINLQATLTLTVE